MEHNDNPFSMFGEGAAVDGPEVTAEAPTAPQPKPTNDPLLESMKRPKVDYQQAAPQSSQDLKDLLGDIPTETPFTEQFEFDTDPDPEADDTEEAEEKRSSSGSMVNLVVKNSDYAFSTLLGWMNDRPASNFRADSDGRALLTEAVGNYSVELGVEFSPKAQLMYSYALVYGGGLITGLVNLGRKAVSWFVGRKKNRTGPTVQEAEIIEETNHSTEPEKRRPGRPRKTDPAPQPRYCIYPGCTNELKPSQKSYCSIAHSAKHRIEQRQQAEK